MSGETGSINRMACEQHWKGMHTTLRAALDRCVPGDRPLVYLDYPVHRNVGDLLIYQGTRKWLTERSAQVLGSWNVRNFAFPELPAGNVILLHGGGNFGDLYPVHQAFRERIVRRYPANRIVVLPQTLHFSKAASLNATADILNAHRDLHLLVRDPYSQEIVQNHFTSSSCQLAPDMASFLYPLTDVSPENDHTGTLYLLRRDIEATSGDASAAASDVDSVDWADLLGSYRWTMRAFQTANLLFGRRMPGRLFEARWHEVARRAIEHCATEFRANGHIVTSRLHGHILASLLGIPNTLLDNSYGKNSRYYDAWHASLPFASLQRYQE